LFFPCVLSSLYLFQYINYWYAAYNWSTSLNLVGIPLFYSDANRIKFMNFVLHLFHHPSSCRHQPTTISICFSSTTYVICWYSLLAVAASVILHHALHPQFLIMSIKLRVFHSIILWVHHSCPSLHPVVHTSPSLVQSISPLFM